MNESIVCISILFTLTFIYFSFTVLLSLCFAGGAYIYLHCVCIWLLQHFYPDGGFGFVFNDCWFLFFSTSKISFKAHCVRWIFVNFNCVTSALCFVLLCYSSWIVAALSFLAHVLTTGFQLSYGLLYTFAEKHLRTQLEKDLMASKSQSEQNLAAETSKYLFYFRFIAIRNL